MTGRLKLIEQQLIGIDSAAFQNLCDVYLSLREQERISINRTGSMLGKQKTVKGTPDTFYRLADGSLRYVEYTTTAAGLVKKIKEDIDKCLDESKTGVAADEVDKIIICFNSRIDVAEETEITKYAASKNARIDLIGLDWLALEIYSKYLILAKDILGIPLDTGQLLPLAHFIEEYDNKAGKLSTPLNNQFLHRTAELADIDQFLNANNIVILSGFPGVGKTKIALESLDKFLLSHSDYEAYAVSKKDIDIGEDLRTHLQTDKNYILLVDDANRQLSNFKQILGVFREKRKGDIKLLLTVRNYAFNDVKNECAEFDPHEICIGKFTDDEITDLIKSDSFHILNYNYQKKIVELADGNARLAVMAARLAKEHQEGFLLGDISDLYDAYFQTFIKDSDIFTNKTLVKTLGLVSFFFTIDRSDKAFVTELLQNFDLDYYAFNEAIDELHKRELIEVQYNNARVSEQVMATYFFYKVFIKDEILSFKTLLFGYFPNWKKRFSDTIIPSNNSFGYNNVFKKIDSTLSEYLQSVYNDEQQPREFFSLFWFYKREEMLAYFHQQVKKLPEPDEPIYNASYETNAFVWDRDKTLDFLTHLFEHHTESFIPALELAFEYSRKKPDAFPELIRRIREKLLFDEPDEHSDFIRQSMLFELLIRNFNEQKAHYVVAFFALAVTFLNHHFQITKGARKNAISFYQYPLPFYEVTRAFREKIWTTLFAAYDQYPKEVIGVLRNFKPGHEKSILEILQFDLSLILPFIDQKLDPSHFENIYFVREFVRWLDWQDIEDKSYQKLKERFISNEYRYFRKLDWNRVRGKQDYDFDKYEDFQKLKEEDLRTSFLFSNENNFEELHCAIQNTLSLEGNNGWSIYQSLDIIAEENFNRDHELGFHFLKSILKNYPLGLNPLYKPLSAIAQCSREWALKLWNLLKQWEHEYKLYWHLAFFDCLPSSLCDEFFRTELLVTLQAINVHVSYLRFDTIEKFVPVDRDIINTALSIASDKIEHENLAIRFSFHFFEKYAGFIVDTTLLSKAYIQQEKMSNHFDLERKGMEAVMDRDVNFLFDYLEAFYTDRDWHNRNTHNHLPFVWNLENYGEVADKAANLIVEHNPYFGVGDYSLNILFSHLNDTQRAKARSFILEYITRYNRDSAKVNAIFDVIRHQFSDLVEAAMLQYLSVNSDLKNFQKIYWRGNGGLYNGDTIIGELHAREWQNIINIVEKLTNQLDMIPIKIYIKEQIAYELKSAEAERKRKFVDPNW
jgi:hypothetical protein